LLINVFHRIKYRKSAKENEREKEEEKERLFIKI